MNSISPEMIQLLRMILSLIAVLGMMGLFAYILKRLGLAQGGSIKSGEPRRLQVIESLPLDARRRAIILRCDGREHLLILNPNGETIVETNISPVDSSPL